MSCQIIPSRDADRGLDLAVCASMSAYAETPFEFVRAAAVKSALGLPRPVRRLIAGAPVVRDGLLLDPEIQMLLRLESIEGRPALETLDPAAARAEIRRSACGPKRVPGRYVVPPSNGTPNTAAS